MNWKIKFDLHGVAQEINFAKKPTSDEVYKALKRVAPEMQYFWVMLVNCKTGVEVDFAVKAKRVKEQRNSIFMGIGYGLAQVSRNAFK